MSKTTLKPNPFSAESMALQQRPPAMVARMVSIAICAMAALAFVYASLASMDIVVSAQGRVIPSGRSKIVQPMEAGVVRTIAVRDGQSVKAGDVLLELDPTTAAADSERLQRDAWEAQAEVMRQAAMLHGSDVVKLAPGMPADIAAQQRSVLDSRVGEQRYKLAALDAELARRGAERMGTEATLAQVRTSLPLMRQKHQMREDLAKTGHVAQTVLIESRLELINLEKEQGTLENRLHEADAALNAARQQRAQAAAEFRSRASAELVDAERKLNTARQELAKATQRRELQTLRSPIDGVVQQLAVTTVGGVVTQAQALMTIVPQGGALEVDAQVLNRDVGQLRVGQRVINKAETFDFTRYGYIEGEVSWIGTDAVVDQKLGPVYPVRIRLDSRQTPQAVNGSFGVLGAGMNMTSDIRTGSRRLIEYFLAPMLRYKQEALRER